MPTSSQAQFFWSHINLVSIDICLATFNGADWLRSFLDSLTRQDFKQWRLIVSDDGSSDETLEILRAFFRNDAERLLLVKRERTGVGIVRNFEDVLAASTADYIFLADQDDIWLPPKLGELHAALRKAEGAEGNPALAYSDMRVVDEDLSCLSGSWWTYSGADARWALSLNHLLVTNTVPGCSMAINRRLLDIALPIPPQVLMHDWWLLLVGVAAGRVEYLPAPTLLYRRHRRAATFSDRGGWVAALQRFIFKRKEARELFLSTAKQASCLLSRVEAKISVGKLAVLRDYVRAAEAGWWLRRWLLLSRHIAKPSFTGTLRFYFWV